VRQLQAAGHRPVVLDNLVYGHRAAVAPEVTFYEEDLGNQAAVTQILRDEAIELVMHFAAFAYVGESMSDPYKYYDNNNAKPLALLAAMRDAGVTKFVFSSSCTVYGYAERMPMDETLPIKPISVYGQTKADMEVLLTYAAKAYGLSVAIFRYFNASGAAADGTIGEDHDPETHLIPLAIAAAQGLRPALTVFGTDYNTPDGTCLRDYIHVDDLSRAHIAVFPQLAEPSKLVHYNLGTGIPASVLEVINAVEEVTGLKVPHTFGERRAGDADAAYADSRKAKEELGWVPEYMDVKSIVATAWKWHESHPQGF